MYKKKYHMIGDALHMTVECSILFRKNTKCDDIAATTHFPVPFGPIIQIFLLKFLLTFFSTLGNFLTVREPPI